MKMDRYLPPDHPLSKVYRYGAALFGLGLTIFGILGFAQRLAFVTTHGAVIFGLSSNGLLSAISIVVGIVLIWAAIKGGAAASTTNAVIGGLFVLSGLANLAVLDTPLNLLAFRIQNVAFSLIVGMLLLFVGLYGRVSMRLPENNPYRMARHHEDPDADHSAELAAEQRRMTEIDELVRAELAVAEGHATPGQQRMVLDDARQRAQATRREVYERQRRDHAGEPAPPMSANNPYE